MQRTTILCFLVVCLTSVSCKEKGSSSKEKLISTCSEYYTSLAACGIAIKQGAIAECEQEFAKLSAEEQKARQKQWQADYQRYCLKKIDTSGVPQDHYCLQVKGVMQECGIPFPDSQLEQCLQNWKKDTFDRAVMVRARHDMLEQTCPRYAHKVSPQAVLGVKGELRLTWQEGLIQDDDYEIGFKYQAPEGFEQEPPREYKGKKILDTLTFNVPGTMIQSLLFTFAGYVTLEASQRVLKYAGEEVKSEYTSSSMPAAAAGGIFSRQNSKTGKKQYSGIFIYPMGPKKMGLMCRFTLDEENYQRFGQKLKTICEGVKISQPASPASQPSAPTTETHQ